MLNARQKTAIFASVILMLMLLPVSAFAQNYWMSPGEDNSVSLEFHKVKFAGDLELGFRNSVVFLSGNFGSSEKFRILVEVPVSIYDPKPSPFDESETLLGNPFIGFEYRKPSDDGSKSLIGRLGIRPPLASDEKFDATVMGLITTFNRFEAFIPDLFTVSAGGGYHQISENGTKSAFDFDASLMIPTENGDAELFVNYNLALWVPSGDLNFGIGFAGRLIATEGDLDFGERTVHQLGLSGNYNSGSFKPGIHFRIPLDDDIADIVDLTYGVDFTFMLN